MLVYIILMVLILAMAYPLIEHKPSDLKKLIFVIVSFAFMLILSMFRYGIGNDYYSYIYIFNKMNTTSWADIITLKCEFEPGFMALNKLISYVTVNTDVMFAIYAVLILVPIGYVIYKHSENAWMSTMMFISLTFFYCTLSFIRQSFAFMFILLSYKFLKENNFFMVVLFSFIACLFHTSAIIFIPIYLFSVIVKPTKISVPIYGVLIAFLYIFSQDIINIGISLLPQYKNYADSSFIKNGYSFIYMIVPTIMLVISLAAHFTSFGKARPKYSAVMTNFTIINFAFWLISTKHFVLERFDMYNAVFLIMYIPSVAMFYKERFLHYLKWKKTASAGDVYVPLPVIDLEKQSKVEKQDASGEEAEKMPEISERDRILAEIMGEDPQVIASAGVNNSEEPEDSRDDTQGYTPRFRINPIISYVVLMAVTLGSCLWYNWFGLNVSSKGFHGVVPYKSVIPAYMEWSTSSESLGNSNCKLSSEKNFMSYLYKLKNGNYTAIITNKSNCVKGLHTGIYSAINYVGLEKLAAITGNDNYVAIIQNGDVIYENSSSKTINYSIRILGKDMSLTGSRLMSSIRIDGVEKSKNLPGLNIVVFDNDTGKIIDRVNFKTSYLMLTMTR